MLRLFNYTEEVRTVTVKAQGRLYRTQLDEVARIFLGKDEVTLTLGPKEIVTLFMQ